MLGEVDQGARLLENLLNIGRGAVASELVGLSEEVFGRTVTYLKERKQFGKLIGEFQALQHRAAELYIDIEISRLEAEVQTYRLAQQRTDSFQFDDSRLARIKGMLKDVRDQVAVGLKSIEYGKIYDVDAPPVDQKAKNTAQIIKDSEEFLGDTSEGGKVVDRK